MLPLERHYRGGTSDLTKIYNRENRNIDLDEKLGGGSGGKHPQSFCATVKGAPPKKRSSKGKKSGGGVTIPPQGKKDPDNNQ